MYYFQDNDDDELEDVNELMNQLFEAIRNTSNNQQLLLIIDSLEEEMDEDGSAKKFSEILYNFNQNFNYETEKYKIDKFKLFQSN